MIIVAGGVRDAGNGGPVQGFLEFFSYFFDRGLQWPNLQQRSNHAGVECQKVKGKISIIFNYFNYCSP